jgi:hypothetical protein
MSFRTTIYRFDTFRLVETTIWRIIIKLGTAGIANGAKVFFVSVQNSAPLTGIAGKLGAAVRFVDLLGKCIAPLAYSSPLVALLCGSRHHALPGGAGRVHDRQRRRRDGQRVLGRRRRDRQVLGRERSYADDRVGRQRRAVVVGVQQERIGSFRRSFR